MLPKINNSDFRKSLQRFSDVRVIGLVAFAVVVLLVSWSSLKVLQVNYELEKQKADLEQQTRIQKLENENLRLKNVYYESDEYVELTARRQLNKAVPGEQLFLVPRSVAMAHTVDLPKSKKQIEAEKQQKAGFGKNLQAWKDFFFHSGGS